MSLIRLLALFSVTLTPFTRSAETEFLATPAHRLDPAAPEWSDLAAQSAHRADTTAEFEERRWFPFRKLPTVLTGMVRVSAAHGLGLHYLTPQKRMVIIDDRGVILREGADDTTPPSDPRATAANAAMLHLLRFDLRALATTFEIYGERNGAAWSLAVVPRDEALRRTLGQITVSGENTAVRRIEMRRSPTQRIEILVAPPLPATPFTADDLRRYFR